MDRIYIIADEQTYQILQIRSNSVPEVQHTVWIDFTEEMVKCTCKGFTVYKYCRHTDAVRELVK